MLTFCEQLFLFPYIDSNQYLFVTFMYISTNIHLHIFTSQLKSDQK